MKIDPQKCLQLYEKLIGIEKKLPTPDNKIEEGKTTEAAIVLLILTETLPLSEYLQGVGDKASMKSDQSVSGTISDGNENTEETNDGNRNEQDAEMKQGEEKAVEIDASVFRTVITELKELYNEFLIHVKLLQKDLVRAAKYDELESKVMRGVDSGRCADLI